MNPLFQQNNENNYSSAEGSRTAFTKIGDLHIYQDGSNRDMVFTSSK
jgi:exopolysaccharide biosynthesis protein